MIAAISRHFGISRRQLSSMAWVILMALEVLGELNFIYGGNDGLCFRKAGDVVTCYCWWDLALTSPLCVRTLVGIFDFVFHGIANIILFLFLFILMKTLANKTSVKVSPGSRFFTASWNFILNADLLNSCQVTLPWDVAPSRLAEMGGPFRVSKDRTETVEVSKDETSITCKRKVVSNMDNQVESRRARTSPISVGEVESSYLLLWLGDEVQVVVLGDGGHCTGWLWCFY
ncbi:unnamed protein product [Cochlearia groenlandica]